MPSRAVLVGVILALCLVTEGRLARIEVRWGLNVTRCPQALSTIDDYYQREGQSFKCLLTLVRQA